MRKGKRWLAAAVSAAMIVQSLASVGPVYAADDGVSIADTFTDSSFRSYVSSNFDTDSNGYLSDAEISNVTSIDVSKCSPAISSLNVASEIASTVPPVVFSCYIKFEWRRIVHQSVKAGL